MITASNLRYELSARTQAISAGGIGAIHQLVQRLGLVDELNRRLNVFQLYNPYSESDHVLNIAYNLLAGGTRLEHLELRRQDETYLNALGARRIPDPTTAGDFCRRFSRLQILELMDVFNQMRLKVWSKQPDSFFDEAVIDDHALFPSALPVRREKSYNAWVTIQIGCDNSCAFCIVPSVRGREMSRPFGEIVDEVGRLAADGVTVWPDLPDESDLVELLRTNSRMPEMLLGDLTAQVSSCLSGGQAIVEMCEQYGLADIEALSDAIISRSEAAVRATIRTLPAGSWSEDILSP